MTEQDYVAEDYAAEAAVNSVFLKYQSRLAEAKWRILRDANGNYVAELNEDGTIAKRRPDACGCADYFFAECKDSKEVTRVGIGCIGHGRFHWMDEGVRRPEWMRTV